MYEDAIPLYFILPLTNFFLPMWYEAKGSKNSRGVSCLHIVISGTIKLIERLIYFRYCFFLNIESFISQVCSIT